MNYKNYFIFLIYFFLIYSCIKEIDITKFSDQYGDFEQELRIEALILPADSTAIIRIDKTIAIDNETLFNCQDDNGNWTGSSCVCDETNVNNQCPKDENDCAAIGGLWLVTESNPFLDGYCDLSVIEESNCLNQIFNLEWSIIDDVGEDGQLGDPTDEDEDFDTDEPSKGEGNGIPDCGEPNVDDLEEITELSGEIHEQNCNTVQIIYNDNQICNFEYSEYAGVIYEGSSIYQSGFEFADTTSCQLGDIIYDPADLDSLYYNYGAYIPSNCPEDFFSKYENGTYSLYIECDDQTIISNNSETIPYPVVFVDDNSLNMDDVGSCLNNGNIYECLNDNFQVDNLEFIVGAENNLLNYISTETWYQAVQYFDPFYSCFDEPGTNPKWVYLHGHPATAYPPSNLTNHFPPGDSPIIFTNEEVVISSTTEEIGCYQYRMYTFSEGYSNYYFASRLNLKDPVRSNLRNQNSGEVVIGGFGVMSEEAVTFKITN